MLLVDTELRPSPIHGIGVFSKQFIPSGSIVWSFTPGFDLEIEPPEIDRLSPPAREQFLRYSYLDVLTGKYVLCFDDGRFFNHSDSPNVIDGLTPDTAQSSIAVRDIFPGEELTCDYRTFDALSRYGMEDPMLAARTNGPGSARGPKGNDSS
jgi:uncharacterized protein